MRKISILKITTFLALYLVFNIANVSILFAEDNDAKTTTNTDTQVLTSATLTRGIVSCKGARLDQIGKLTPTVGQFVPVWDEVVSYNTNMLLYKECVLDAINNRLKQAFIASVVKNAVKSITGDGQNPKYVTDLKEYLNKRKQKRLKNILNDNELKDICSPFKDKVIDAIKRTIENKSKPFACSLDEVRVRDCLDGNIEGCGGLSGFYRFAIDPNNNPVFAYYNTLSYINSQLAEEEFNERQILSWGRGFKPQRQEERITLDDGSVVTREKIVTPGFLIAQYAADIVGTGLRQLESADELNEIIGALMQQIGTAAITGEGFTGLAVSQYGPSYIDLLVDETGEEVRSGIVRQYYDQLSSILASTKEYIKTIKNYLAKVNEAENILRSNELACIEGSGAMLYGAQKALKKRACQSWYGKDNCSATISLTYDRNAIETYESNLGKVSAVAYLPKSNQVSFWFKSGAKRFGENNTTSYRSIYSNYKFTSSPQIVNTQDIPNGQISVYLKQGNLQTTKGVFKFEKQEIGEDGYKQYMLKFGFDLPDVTIVAKHPTTTQTISMNLSLDKRYTKNVIETDELFKYQTRVAYYQAISKLEKYADEVENAMQSLVTDPTQSDLDNAQAVIDKSSDSDIQSSYNIVKELEGQSQSVIDKADAEVSSWQEAGSWCGPKSTGGPFATEYVLNKESSFCLYLSNHAEKSYYPVCNGL